MTLIRIERNPSRAQLLVFAAAWCVACGSLACVAYAKGNTTTASILGSAAIAMPIVALVASPLARWAYLALAYATYPIGWAVSHLVLLGLYYGVFTPIGLTMRVCGRDSLQRRLEPRASSYWLPRTPAKSPARYFRQS